MTVSRTMLNTLTAAAIAAACLTGMAGNAQAYTCKSKPTQVTAKGFLKTGATKKAVSQWSAKAKAQYGLPWSVWSIGLGQKVKCTKAGRFHSCFVSAKPCLYVVQ